MSKPAVIECHDLSKSFSEGKLKVDVLASINISIEQGERIAIVGASGSGKSTLLHLLGGLDTPDTGSVSVMGQSISEMKPAARGKFRNVNLGFVYQFHHLLPEFTALENVAMPLLIGGKSPADAKQSAMNILDKVGLGERASHKPGEMSGGERQRAAIARALVTQPKCVLADEPTGNLDYKTADKVYDMMLELNKSLHTSFIVVTHDPNLAARMDKVYTLQEGRLMSEAVS